MFTSARIKLTLWYLLIIMFISSIFSVVIYSLINQELVQIENRQRAIWERQVQYYLPLWETYKTQQTLRGLPSPEIPNELIEPDLSGVLVARSRVQKLLLFVNLTILGGAGLAGYFLASKTLQPIREMVDEQNRFVTDASHELRTPLTALRTELEVSMRDKNLSLQDTKKILSSNLEEVIHLQTLSENLMRLTKYSKGYNSVQFEKNQIRELVNEAVKKVLPLARKKQIKVVQAIKDVSIEVEKFAIIELLVILLDNAIKYSTENTTIEISTTLGRKDMTIMIKDQGIGIAKKDIPHLFDRFYRADSSRCKTDAEGYGLGLAIAKQIVNRHRGELNVKSKLNVGSTFLVTLPYRQ